MGLYINVANYVHPAVCTTTAETVLSLLQFWLFV